MRSPDPHCPVRGREGPYYIRTSPGTGFTAAIMEHTATATIFYKSSLRWEAFGFRLTLRDGTWFYFPANGLLRQVGDRNGNTITIDRAEVETNGSPKGSITKIRAPK